MEIPQLLQYLFAGFTSGSVYALIALGFTLIYNTSEVINFAQGEFVMLGGMLAAVLCAAGIPLIAAFSVSVAAVTAIGFIVARFALFSRPNWNPLTLIIMTIGLSIVLRGGAMVVWGKDAKAMPPFSDIAPIGVHGAYLMPQSLWVMGFTALITVSLAVFFRFSRGGRAMKACAVNRRGALLCGIRPERMMVGAFALSAAIAGATGAIVAPITLTGYDVGIMLGLKGFCGAIAGGLNSFTGAVIGGLSLGILEALGAGLISSHFKDAIAFLILLLILFTRPSGLTGRRSA